MRPHDLPVVRQVLASGADDRVLDALLLLGPVVILVLALLGRSPVTVAIAAAYLLAFLLHIVDAGRRSTE